MHPLDAREAIKAGPWGVRRGSMGHFLYSAHRINGLGVWGLGV